MSRKLTIMVIFALAMCVLIVPASNTYATDAPQSGYYNPAYDFSYDENLTLSRYYNAENDFFYKEAVIPQTNQIVRKYENPNFVSSSRNNTTQTIAKTKKILATLGMSEDFIDELSAQRLNDYASGKSIEITTSYMKLVGNDSYPTYVSKEEAEEGARGVGPGTETFPIDIIGTGGNGGGGDDPDPEPLPEGSYQGEFEDEMVDSYDIFGNPDTSYVKMVLTALYRGEGAYLFSADIEWLTVPPQNRYEETLGILMENQTLVANSIENSWYSYEECRTSGMNVEYFSHKHYMTGEREEDLYVHYTGMESGVVMKFNYPEDMTGGVYPVNHTYFTFKAHLEAETIIKSTSINWSFNFAATYSHLIEEKPEPETDIECSLTLGVVLQFEFLSIGLEYTMTAPPNDEVEMEWARFFAMTPTPLVYNPE